MIKNLRRRKSLINMEQIMSETKAEEKLINIFSSHIGKENAISEYDLFKDFFNYNMDQVTDYQYYFYADVIKKFLKFLRHTGSLFVISEYRNYYVLSNESELEVYHKQLKKQIQNLELAYEKAQAWVSEEQYLKIKKKKKILDYLTN